MTAEPEEHDTTHRERAAVPLQHAISDGVR
jgi:hypothetical protein